MPWTKHLTLRRTMPPALGLVSLVLTVGVALAAPADIDPSFSQDGRVAIDKGKSEKASSVALQPDGKLVVAGTAVYRLTTDGSADASFAGDGTAELGSGEFAKALAIQTDGKLLVGGIVYRTGFVYRLNPDGTRDLGFGQNGRIRIDGGMSGNAVLALALQPDGKILVGGQLNINGFPNAAVHRFHPNRIPPEHGRVAVHGGGAGGDDLPVRLQSQREGLLVSAAVDRNRAARAEGRVGRAVRVQPVQGSVLDLLVVVGADRRHARDHDSAVRLQSQREGLLVFAAVDRDRPVTAEARVRRAVRGQPEDGDVLSDRRPAGGDDPPVAL